MRTVIAVWRETPTQDLGDVTVISTSDLIEAT